MNKQDLMREVDKLDPSQRDTYEAVKVYAKTLADALAFAKGTIRVESGTSVTTITHVMQDAELQAQVDDLPRNQREMFEEVFFYRGLGKLLSFDEAMAIAKSGKLPAVADAGTRDAEHPAQEYRDRVSNAWKGT